LRLRNAPPRPALACGERLPVWGASRSPGPYSAGKPRKGRGSARDLVPQPNQRQPNGAPGKKPPAPSVSKSVIVDPSAIIRQHVTVVIVPIVGVPDSWNEAMEVPPMNTAVTDEGETVIAAYAVCHKGGGVRDTTAHQWIASNAAAHKRLADNATVHKRVAAGYSTPGKLQRFRT
jgi:hypothetical protein